MNGSEILHSKIKVVRVTIFRRTLDLQVKEMMITSTRRMVK